MEIKLIIDFSDKAAQVIANLTEAIKGISVLPFPESLNSPQGCCGIPEQPSTKTSTKKETVNKTESTPVETVQPITPEPAKAEPQSAHTIVELATLAKELVSNDDDKKTRTTKIKAILENIGVPKMSAIKDKDVDYVYGELLKLKD